MREIAIPWAEITGGTRPASFAWLGYIGYNNSASDTGVYGTVPFANPGGAFNQAATTKYYERYYIVNDTSSASCTPPFNHDSFVFNNTASESNFGAITVWDFTMNTTNVNISRNGSSGRDWIINHNLRVDNGTIDFFSTGSATNIGGDIIVNSSTSPALKLTPTNVNLGGNFVDNASSNFLPNGGTLTFNGSSTQTITTTGTLSFNNLTINTGSSVTTSSTFFVNGNVTNNGAFTATGGTVTFQGNPSTIGGSNAASFFGLQYSQQLEWACRNVKTWRSFTDNGTFTAANNSTVSVMGSLTIGSGNTFTAGTGSTLNSGGDFINNGTFTPSTGTVVFNGAGVQNLTLNTLLTFKNLTVSSGVTLTETVAANNATTTAH